MELYTFAFGLLVASLLAIATPAFTQDKGVTTEQVVREWDAREKKVRSARIKWTAVKTLAKSHAASFAGKEGEKFDKDVVLRMTRTLTIDGNRTRLEDDSQRWSSKNKFVEPITEVTTFDGKRYGSTILQSSIVDHPETTISSREQARELDEAPMMPIWYSIRGTLLSTRPWSIKEYRPTGVSTVLMERPCFEFARESMAGEREQLYVDSERDLQVVRYSRSVKGQIRSQTEITAYSREPQIGWFPRAWEYVFRVPKGEVAIIIKCEVLEIEINPAVDAKSFDPMLPPRSRIADLTSGKEIQYGILPDGSKGQEVLGGGHDFDTLMAPPTRWYGSWRLWLGVAGAFLVLAVVLAIRRRHGNAEPARVKT